MKVSVNEAGLPEAGPASAMTLLLSSTIQMGVNVVALAFVAVYCMLVNVTAPKFGSVGWVAPTRVGSSSIHSAESAGPLYVKG